MSDAQFLTPIPDNIRIGWGADFTRPKLVESDVFNVCERIKEIDPRLFVVLQEEHPTHKWVIMENCVDGECRMVKRYENLTPAILEDLRYMLAVPFAERLKILDRDVEESNALAARFMSPEDQEQFVYNFQKGLVDCNFVDPKWSKNMPLKPRKQ